MNSRLQESSSLMSRDTVLLSFRLRVFVGLDPLPRSIYHLFPS